MKKLYTTILIIAVALFISCDEQKAKDEIKKALDKTVDKTTPKPAVTKPVLSATRVRVGTAATFSKVKGYSYKLKKVINGVSLEVSNEKTGQVSSTQAASGVVIVATFEGKSTESEPIEFVDVTLTKPALSATRVRVGTAATFPKELDHTYALIEEKTGVTLSEATGNTMQVTATQVAINVIIVATFEGTSEESDPINFLDVTLTKPVVSATRVRVGQAATFPKVLGHTYTLKQAVNGVSLDVSDENTGQVSSTQAATGVVIVATLDSNSVDSNPIEFVDVTLTKPVVSATSVRVGQVATFPKALGHTYTLEEAKTGVTLSEGTGNTMEVTATQTASNVIIVATLDDDTIESNPIEFVEITKPAFSEVSAPWDTVITFPIESNHVYALKEEKTGVALTKATSSNRMQVTATQSVQNVIILVVYQGTLLFLESEPIEFTRIPGNTLSFAQATRTENPDSTFTQTATKSGTVAGDTRNIKYSVSPNGNRVDIDSSSGEVRVLNYAIAGDYAITAELQQNAQYEKSTATYILTVVE